jgi:yecA family protein
VLPPTYDQIQLLLTQERSLADAAEAHGTLAGCLCGASDYRFEDWLREILPEGRAAAAATATLQELYTATAAALRQPDMEFELLLPDDEHAIDVRTAALAQWCQGFLYGLGTGAIPDASKLPGDVGEIVRDFIEITRAGVDAEQDEESNESAYAELVEFVRVGVQLLFEELAGARRPTTSTAAPPLH